MASHDPAPGAAPAPPTASGMADAIRTLLDLAIDAATDPDDGMFDLAEPLAHSEILTYAEAGVRATGPSLPRWTTRRGRLPGPSTPPT